MDPEGVEFDVIRGCGGFFAPLLVPGHNIVHGFLRRPFDISIRFGFGFGWDGCFGWEDGVGGGFRVEATGGAFDLAHAQEVIKGALDLEGG